jgi:hypothetical protein
MPNITYVPSRRTVHAVWYVAAALLIVLVAWLAWAVVTTDQRLEKADAELREQAASIAAARENQERLARSAENNAEAAAVLAEQVRELGERPAVEPTQLPEVIEGPPGEPGQRGQRGPQGPSGDVGETGDRGPRGYMGRVGERGPQGEMGPRGEPGATGPKGEPGEPGATGATGPQGPPGPAGERGPQGPPGPAGSNGSDGRDAFPFTFSFIVEDNPAQSTTYTCTITDPAEPATCTSDD